MEWKELLYSKLEELEVLQKDVDQFVSASREKGLNTMMSNQEIKTMRAYLSITSNYIQNIMSHLNRASFFQKVIEYQNAEKEYQSCKNDLKKAEQRIGKLKTDMYHGFKCGKHSICTHKFACWLD